MEYPSVSIVVTAYNEEEDIQRLLNSLMKLKYPKKKLEIIIVDDGSTDKTPEIVSRYPVKLVKGGHKGVGHARQLGWKKSKNGLVVFLDADMIVSPDYIKEMVRVLENNKELVGVEGTEFLYNKDKFIARMSYLRSALGWKQAKVLIPRMYKRKILEEFNGVNPTFEYYIDWELLKRVLNKGYKVGRAHKAKVWHKQVESWGELFRQCRWNGRSMVFSFKKYRKGASERILFVLLNSLLPIYIIFLFLPFPLKILGFTGLFLFLFYGLKRSVQMFLITGWKESFLTPIFDFISMSFTLFGILDKLFNVKLRHVLGRI